MVITNSPDISNLLVKVTFDISGSVPQILLENLSTGNNLAGVSYAFIVTSPSGTPIHSGVITAPDVVGVWDMRTLSDPFPRPFNQIEFSGGAPYEFMVIAKDSNGTVYTNGVQSASICRPAGNLETSKNTFGKASATVIVKCEKAGVFFEDTTYHSYKGIDGAKVSSLLKVIYPIDETQNIPEPFSISSFTSALVPISYSSSNYQFLQSSIYDYDLGNNVHALIKYQQIESFAVWCNVDLEPLLCQITKLVDDLQNGSCVDAVQANKNLLLINSKLSLVFIGIMQPLTGVDVPDLIEQIKKIGGFDCNCFGVATGIIPTSASVIDGYTFDIISQGGDVGGAVTRTGNLIHFNLHDISYVVNVSPNQPITAFTFTASSGTYLKTYSLNVDATQLATDILNIIKNNGSLVNLFNSIVAGGAVGSLDLIVDGECIFASTSSCDYCFTLYGVPADTTYAILLWIAHGGIKTPINYSFNFTNFDGLQYYLNTLGLGSFTVTCYDTDKCKICSSANIHSLEGLGYKTSGNSNSLFADFTKVCTGFAPVTANFAVQKIIDYLCGLTDKQVVSFQDYSVCWIDGSGSKITDLYKAGTPLSTILLDLTVKGCSTIDSIAALNVVNCGTVLKLFPDNIKPLTGSDYMLGSKGGDCAKITMKELGLAILNYGQYDDTFIEAFCALVSLCGGGKKCDTYSLFSVSTTPYNGACPVLVDYVYYITQTTETYSVTITQVIFANTPSVPQTVSISHKISDDSPYVVDTSSVSVNSNGELSSPFTISYLVPEGEYDIKVADNCSSPSDFVVKRVAYNSRINGSIQGFNPVTIYHPSSTGTVTAAPGSLVRVRMAVAGSDAGASLSGHVNGVAFSITNATSPVAFAITMPLSGIIDWDMTIVTTVSSEAGGISLY